ncbi:MAG: hypothetical protein HUU20_12945 [Pirellulales bacterium]|nr:hypothetical protein [Pirellulales bacterium]
MSESLLPKRFLFRFSVPCRYRQPIWTAKGPGLDESYRLANLAELEDTARLIDFRMAWSETGLAFRAHVIGKSQPPWCRTNRPEDSDGMQIWIDTRDVHNVHRAGRFCHRFLFMPVGGGSRLDHAVAQWLPINRAKEHPRAIVQGQIRVRSERLADGYALEAFLAAEALTGFDPQEHPRLGFTYAVIDRELGEVTFSAESPMPYQEDPSLWATLELAAE